MSLLFGGNHSSSLSMTSSWMLVLFLSLTMVSNSRSFQVMTGPSHRQKQHQVLSRNNCRITTSTTTTIVSMSDWSDFTALDDDDDDDVLLDELKVDKREYAVEEDSQEIKAQVGAAIEGPSIENDAPPIQVPAGSQLELDEETVMGVLSACRGELGTLFGYTEENRGVGITGGVDYVEMDGPTVVVRLKGRFWHERSTVLDRVSNYLMQRIPEIIDVSVEDEWQLTDEANEVW